MCLITYQEVPNIALHDIVCWKIVKCITYANNISIYTGLYQGSKYKYKKHNKCDKFNKETKYIEEKKYGFHSFVNKEDAEKELEILKHFHRAFNIPSENFEIYQGLATGNYILKKCIIPRGTIYWYGKWDSDRCHIDSYCSKNLIFDEFIDNNAFSFVLYSQLKTNCLEDVIFYKAKHIYKKIIKNLISDKL